MIKISTLSDWPQFLGATLKGETPFAISTDQLAAFLRASGDDNPVHKEAQGIVPGNLLLCRVPQFLQQHIQLAEHLVGMSVGYAKVRFKAPVYLGDKLCFGAEITHVRAQARGTYVTYKIALQRETGDPVMTAEMRDLYTGNQTGRSSLVRRLRG